MSRQNKGLTRWAIVALVIALSGKFEGIPAPGIQATIAVQMIVFFLTLALSSTFRQYLRSLDPIKLTVFHSWRIVPGAMFLYYHYQLGMLPWSFAVPGGYGDIAVGITALFAARMAKSRHKRALLVWQVLALCDLLNIVRAGFVNGLSQPDSMTPLTRLPLNLLPLMLVPLTLMAHIAAIYGLYAHRDGSMTAEQ